MYILVKAALVGMGFAVALMSLAGCSNSGSAVSEMPRLSGEFLTVYETTESDFIRAVVEDGELTLAEMREAAELANNCFEAVGSGFRVIEPGGFTVWLSSEDAEAESIESERAAFECEMRYIDELRSLWHLANFGAEGVDFDELIAECLVRNDLVAVGFTGQHFQEISTQCAFAFDYETMGDLSEEELQVLIGQHWEDNSDCRPQLPGGTYLDEGLAWDCQMDPLNH